MSIVVRDGRDDEKEKVKLVTLAAYSQYETIMPPDIWEMYREGLKETLNQEGDLQRIVAESDGKMVGSVLFYFPNVLVYGEKVEPVPWAEIRLLAVEPAYRGKGIAKILLDECERRSLQLGCSYLGLHTDDSMQVAIKLYEKRGYLQIPPYDFSPAEGLLVKAYRKQL